MEINKNFSNPSSFLSSLNTHVQWEKICLPLLLVISFVAIFFQLGARSLENQCYIRYAEVAREMIRSGDWIVPRLEGELFLHKPPLIIWLIALPSALWGTVTPFLARIPSALSAVAVVGLTFFLGKKMFRDFRVGAIAGLILLSSKEFFWQARTARSDMVIALLILFSFLCFYVAYDSSGKKRFLLLTLFLVSMALGTLTKGPIVILFYLGTVVAFLFFKKKLKMFIEPGFLWGWVFFALILLSWVLPYLARVPFAMVAEKFNLSEILSRPEPWYYYLLQFWPRFAPWSFFLPSAVFFLLRKNPNQQDARLFLLCWTGIILALIFPFHNKTYRYFLPIFPTYSIILGAAFREGFLSFSTHKEDWLVRSWKYSTWACLFIFIVSFVAAPFLTWRFTHSFTAIIVGTAVFLIGGLLVGYGLRKREMLSKVVVISLLSLLTYETYYYFISREDEKHSPVMKIAAEIKSHIKPEDLTIFGIVGSDSSFLDFYFDRVVPKLNNLSEVLKFCTDDSKPRSCLMSERSFKQVFENSSLKKLEVFPIRYKKKTTYFLIVAKKE